MKQSNLQITLPKPCNEDWDAMAPADRGRYCASCQKTVVDFTLLSDSEIIDIFKKAKDSPPCGHFLSTQLERPLIDTRYKPSLVGLLVKRAAAVVILFQSIAATALAQQVKKNATIVKHANTNKAQVKDATRRIKGKVLDYQTKEPVSGIRVQIKGTQIDSITDKAGVFVLTLPDSFSTTMAVLESPTQHEEYTIVEEIVNPADTTNKEVVLYRYVTQTLPQHIIQTTDYNSSIRTLGGAPVPTHYTQTKITGWQKVTKPFRKKKQQ